MKLTPKITAASSSILLLFLFVTNPETVPSVLLIVPFVLLFISIAGCVPLVLGRVAGQRVARAGVVAASVPVLLLVLQSLGQLTIRDILAVAALVSVAYFYVSRLGMRTAPGDG